MLTGLLRSIGLLYLRLALGKDFEKISNILKSNPDSNFELYLNGKPLKEYYKDNN